MNNFLKSLISQLLYKRLGNQCSWRLVGLVAGLGTALGDTGYYSRAYWIADVCIGDGEELMFIAPWVELGAEAFLRTANEDRFWCCYAACP